MVPAPPRTASARARRRKLRRECPSGRASFAGVSGMEVEELPARWPVSLRSTSHVTTSSLADPSGAARLVSPPRPGSRRLVLVRALLGGGAGASLLPWVVLLLGGGGRARVRSRGLFAAA